MKINPNIFRAYDIRGIYPQELQEEAFSKIAQAFTDLYPKAEKIVVARDPRLSSPSLTEAIRKNLVEAGKEVIDIGIAPDSLFYFSIFHYYFDAGFMVSASHNPKEYNGLTIHVRKPGKENSEDVIGQDLEKIKELVFRDKKNKKLSPGGKIVKLDPSADYIAYVTSKIKLKKPLKIVIDSSNGATGFLPERVFQELGCRVKTIYGEFDGTFPNHLPDPYKEENLKDAKAELLRQKADMGFVYDCDGDRIGALDNRGRFISGDFCLLILARQALQKKKGPIVHDMRVSKAFLDEMRKQEVETHFSVSHHNAVIKKIIETKAVFGGEITLHFLFPLDYYLCDEAIFASLKLAEIASQQEDFAQYLDSLPSYSVSPEVFIDTTDEDKFRIIKNLQNYLRENRYDFIDIDGARINFPNGWALARAANTTPHIKCRFEGDTNKDLIEIEKKCLEVFKKAGIPITKNTHRELGLK